MGEKKAGVAGNERLNSFLQLKFGARCVFRVDLSLCLRLSSFPVVFRRCRMCSTLYLDHLVSSDVVCNKYVGRQFAAMPCGESAFSACWQSTKARKRRALGCLATRENRLNHTSGENRRQGDQGVLLDKIDDWCYEMAARIYSLISGPRSHDRTTAQSGDEMRTTCVWP